MERAVRYQQEGVIIMDRDVLLLYIKNSQIPSGALDQIRATAPQLEIALVSDMDEARTYADRVVIAAGHPPVDLLASFPRLAWFQQFYAGADWLTNHPGAVTAPFILTNASGVHPVQITEHVFAGVLSLARKLPQAFVQQQRSEWNGKTMQNVFELQDKTLLVVGAGAIGERIAIVGAAFGMTPIGIRRSAKPAEPPFERMYQQDALHVLLPEADVIVLTVPLTEETHHMLGEEQFGLMKPGAVVVNIGRGGTIDESALLAALEDERIRGAMLDVFEQEPLPADAPHWHAKNLIITPHTAGASPRYYERAFDIFLDNLEEFIAGNQLTNVVDKELGY